MDAETLKSLRSELDEYLNEFDDCFRSDQSRAHLRVFVRGQLGPLKRKSVEPMALEAGVAPRTLQEFLSLHVWDQAAMRRRVREIVVRDHADENAIGVVDGTDFQKKGRKTVGVKRQHCGELGKVENCLATVHLAYVAPEFRTLIASDIYLPEEWADDAERRKEAGVPSQVVYRPKWKIALDLIGRALADKVPLRWIAGDAEYGHVPEFMDCLDHMGLLYVIDVPKNVVGWTPDRLKQQKKQVRIDQLWPRAGPSWETYRVKDTTRGPIVWRARSTSFLPKWRKSRDGLLRLIVVEDVPSGETKYLMSNAPDDVPVATLLTVATSRWNVERAFEDAKQEVGMRDFEVRKYEAVQRHFALSLVSLLFLSRAAKRLGGEKSEPLVTLAGAYRRRSSARPTPLAASSG